MYEHPAFWIKDDDFAYTMSYPLSTACKYGNIEIVKLLINYGHDMKYRNWQPVRTAIRYGTPEVVSFLMECGAESEIREWGFDLAINYCELSESVTPLCRS